MTNEAPFFSSLNDKLAQMVNGSCFKWLALGRFDHLIVECGKDSSSVLNPESVLSTHIEAASHSGFYGRFIAPESFSLAEAYESHRLAGFCTVRVAEPVRLLCANDASRFIEKITEKIGDTLTWALGTTTGWDDYALFLFSNSYTEISNAIGKLRSLRTDDLGLSTVRKPPVHCLLTTCTIPLIRFDWQSSFGHGLLPTSSEAPAALLRNAYAKEIKKNLSRDEISWAIRLELRPGHWDAFKQKMFQRSKEFVTELESNKVFGQVDLRISQRQGDLAGLVDFFVHVIFPLIVEPGTPIRSMETHLHLNDSNYSEDIGASALIGKSGNGSSYDETLSGFTETIYRQCTAYGLPEHTINAIKNTFRNIDSLHSQDLLNGEFSTLQEVCRQFLYGISNVSLEKRTLEKMRQLSEATTEWLIYIERCFADRFRGLYPTGESIATRIATYHGSHQRFLHIADYLAKHSVDLSLALVEKRREHLELHKAEPLKLSLATCLGNSPNAWYVDCLRFFRTGFIDVPVNQVFNFSSIIMIAHEIGHHVTKAYLRFFRSLQFHENGAISLLIHNLERTRGKDAYLLALLNNEHEIVYAALNVTELDIWHEYEDAESNRPDEGVPRLEDLDVVRQFFEVLADLFSCCLCSKGNAVRHLKHTETNINSHYSLNSQDRNERDLANSCLVDHGLRLSAVKSIIRATQRAQEGSLVPDSFATEFIANGNRKKIINAAITQGPETAQSAKKTSTELTMTLKIFDVLMENWEFNSLIIGIVDMASASEFLQQDSETLSSLRNHLETGSLLLYDDLRSIDHLWSIIVSHRQSSP